MRALNESSSKPEPFRAGRLNQGSTLIDLSQRKQTRNDILPASPERKRSDSAAPGLGAGVSRILVRRTTALQDFPQPKVGDGCSTEEAMPQDGALSLLDPGQTDRPRSRFLAVRPLWSTDSKRLRYQEGCWLQRNPTALRSIARQDAYESPRTHSRAAKDYNINPVIIAISAWRSSWMLRSLQMLRGGRSTFSSSSRKPEGFGPPCHTV